MATSIGLAVMVLTDCRQSLRKEFLSRSAIESIRHFSWCRLRLFQGLQFWMAAPVSKTVNGMSRNAVAGGFTPVFQSTSQDFSLIKKALDNSARTPFSASEIFSPKPRNPPAASATDRAQPSKRSRRVTRS